MSGRTCIVLGTLLAAVAVGLGAFGAHWLRTTLPKWYAEDWQRMLETWEVGVRYQMYHAFALIALGIWIEQRAERSAICPALLFFFGTLLFSGLLYALVLSGLRVLGAIVPVGGVLLIAGWLCWMWKVAKG